MVSAHAQRTLVKSPPELWAELSDPASLARHLGELGEIRITRLQPEKRIEWASEQASGTVLIKPSGWGTRVTLTASGQPKSDPEPAPEPLGAEPPAREDTRHSSAHEHDRDAAPADATPGAPPAGADRPPVAEAAQPQRAGASPASARIRITAPLASPASPTRTPGSPGSPASAGVRAAAESPAPAPDTPPAADPATAPPQASTPAASDAPPAPPMAPELPEAALQAPTRRGLLARLWRRLQGERGDGAGHAETAAAPDAGPQQASSAAAPASPESSRPEAAAAGAEDPPLSRDPEPPAEAPADPHSVPSFEPAAPEAEQARPADAGVQAAEESLAGPPAPLDASSALPEPEQTSPPAPVSDSGQPADELAAEQVTAVLTSVLDRLGAAHHRPFSRA